MVLVPSGFAWTSLKQSDFRLIAAQGPDSGVGLPVFTLVPRRSYQGKLHPDHVPRPAKSRTRAYGGHDLIISGSMSDEDPGPPSFTLTPAKKTQAPSKYSETKRKK